MLQAMSDKAIPFIVNSSTLTKGTEKAGIDRTTVYAWLEQSEFKAELDRQRKQVSQQAFGILEQSVTILTYACDINESGWIVGGGQIDGHEHYFLLRPIPEPATLSLLAVGWLALIRRRK